MCFLFSLADVNLVSEFVTDYDSLVDVWYAQIYRGKLLFKRHATPHNNLFSFKC